MIPQRFVDSVGQWDAETQNEVLKMWQSAEGGKKEWRTIAKDNLEAMATNRQEIALRDAKIKQLQSMVLGNVK